MGVRSGLGVVDIALLESIAILPEDRRARGVRSVKVLRAVEESIGLAPDYAYPVLVDLARPWIMPVTLVSGIGNFGSKDGHPPAGYSYTSVRLSAAGKLALAAERNESAPVPVGLINGSMYGGGDRPPLRPQAVIDAIRTVMRRPEIADEELVSIVGAPYFASGCEVICDVAEFASGMPSTLRLQARLQYSDDGNLIIENFPPQTDMHVVAESIREAAKPQDWGEEYPEFEHLVRLPVREIIPSWATYDRGDRLTCVPLPDADRDLLQRQMMELDGMSLTLPVRLGAPLAVIIRDWVAINQAEDIIDSLRALVHSLGE